MKTPIDRPVNVVRIADALEAKAAHLQGAVRPRKVLAMKAKIENGQHHDDSALDAAIEKLLDGSVGKDTRHLY